MLVEPLFYPFFLVFQGSLGIAKTLVNPLTGSPGSFFFRGELSSLFMPMLWTNEGYNHHLEIHSPYKQSTTHSPFMSGFPAWNSHSWAFFVVEAMSRIPSWTRRKNKCLRSLQRLLLASCEKGFLAVFCPFFSGKFLRKMSRQVQQKVEWSRKLHVCFEVVKRYCSSILESSAPWN